MKLFISYSSTRAELCERLRLALEAEGHEVFADRADLPAGEGFHERLRDAIAAADVFLFLVSPESVAPGSYTLAELSFAEQRWRRPAGHVLPVVIAPTEMTQIPPYLRAVTLLQPRGDVVAETVAAVARLGADRPRRRFALAAAIVLVLALGAAGAAWLHQQKVEREAAAAEAARVAQAVAAAAQLCEAGNYALGWQQLATLPAPHAQQDCGMLWLRASRIGSGQTFGELVDRIQPVLAKGLVGASGPRAGDLHAHLGWGDFLRSRDGVPAPDPAVQYDQALKQDPDNAFAHAMWGHWLLWASPQPDEAARHFAAALKTGRHTASVRRLQIAAYYNRPYLWPKLLPVLGDMQRNGEPVPEDQRGRLFNNVLVTPLFDADTRDATLAALPPAELLSLFEALQPPEARAQEPPTAAFAHALLQSAAGQSEAARQRLASLRTRLRSQQASGRIVEQTDQLLTRLNASR